MSSELIIKRLTGGTFFKMLFIGVVAIHLVTSVIVAILVALGILPLEPSAADISTITTLGIVLAYFTAGILFSPLLTCLLWISIWPGLWVYAFFRPIHLSYLVAENDNQT